MRIPDGAVKVGAPDWSNARFGSKGPAEILVPRWGTFEREVAHWSDAWANLYRRVRELEAAAGSKNQDDGGAHRWAKADNVTKEQVIQVLREKEAVIEVLEKELAALRPAPSASEGGDV